MAEIEFKAMLELATEISKLKTKYKLTALESLTLQLIGGFELSGMTYEEIKTYILSNKTKKKELTQTDILSFFS